MQEAMRRMQSAGSGTGIVLSVPADSATAVSEIALTEEDDRYLCILRAEGVDEESIRIMVEAGALSVTGRRTLEQTQTHQGKIVAHVRQTEQFTRSAALPGPVDPACIRTKFSDGLLTIDVPKAKPLAAAPLP